MAFGSSFSRGKPLFSPNRCYPSDRTFEPITPKTRRSLSLCNQFFPYTSGRQPRWNGFMTSTVTLFFSVCGVLASLCLIIHAIRSDRITSQVARQMLEVEDQSAYPSDSLRRSIHQDIPIFYNLYVNASNDEERQQVTDIVHEQFSWLQMWHQPVYVHSIGQELPIPNTTLLKHHIQATEMVTLHSLWEFCRDDSHYHTNVVYLHSKGSFHPSPLNDQLRKFDTLGALSYQCSTAPDTCNVCSSRFSPFPHPHAPGNMWLARCSYIKQLVDPMVFEQEMNIVKRTTIGNIAVHPTCLGTERFSAEHWVHSHPTIKPCDLYTNPKFGWGYENLEEFRDAGDFVLEIGPRFPRRHWKIGCPFSDLRHRLNEYKLLYDMVPPDDWWGWEFWISQI